FLGSLNASPPDIGYRCSAKGLAEGAEEMARAHLHDIGEIGDSNARVQFIVDISCDALCSPWSETALQIRRFRVPAPSLAQIDSQQRRRALDAALCRATVG